MGRVKSLRVTLSAMCLCASLALKNTLEGKNMIFVFVRNLFFLLGCVLCMPLVAMPKEPIAPIAPTIAPGAAPTQPKTNLQLKAQISWQPVEQGLDVAKYPLTKQAGAELVILRFDPQYFDFVLHSTGKNASYPKTLDQWATENALVAVINASMYLPGGRSTGYMRDGTYINNDHIATKFGAFFVAQPKNGRDASVKIVEKKGKDTASFLDKYHLVVQNYRLIDSQRQILWSAGGQKHSIAAVGEDGQGRILFLHCRNPIDAHAFAALLLRLPLDVRTVMYVEGGAQAGMVLRQGEKNTFWGGRHPADFFLGNVAVALPNVLGVQRKKALLLSK